MYATSHCPAELRLDPSDDGGTHRIDEDLIGSRRSHVVRLTLIASVPHADLPVFSSRLRRATILFRLLIASMPSGAKTFCSPIIYTR